MSKDLDIDTCVKTIFEGIDASLERYLDGRIQDLISEKEIIIAKIKLLQDLKTGPSPRIAEVIKGNRFYARKVIKEAIDN